jgi:putative cytotoxic protein
MARAPKCIVFQGRETRLDRGCSLTPVVRACVDSNRSGIVCSRKRRSRYWHRRRIDKRRRRVAPHSIRSSSRWVGAIGPRPLGCWHGSSSDLRDQCLFADSQRGTRRPASAVSPFQRQRSLGAFPDAHRVTSKTPLRGGGLLRRRWADPGGGIYEWDRQVVSQFESDRP